MADSSEGRLPADAIPAAAIAAIARVNLYMFLTRTKILERENDK